VLAAIESLLVLKANSYVVKKVARRLRNQLERLSNNNKKVKKEEQYVLVL
jgi:hypothetical protein